MNYTTRFITMSDSTSIPSLPQGSGKKVMNRYEKQIQKEKQRKMQGKSSHAISISVEGRKMPL